MNWALSCHVCKFAFIGNASAAVIKLIDWKIIRFIRVQAAKNAACLNLLRAYCTSVGGRAAISPAEGSSSNLKRSRPSASWLWLSTSSAAAPTIAHQDCANEEGSPVESRNDDHRQIREFDQLIGDAADQEPLDRSRALLSNHNDVGMLLLGDGQDRLGDISCSRFDPDRARAGDMRAFPRLHQRLSRGRLRAIPSATPVGPG